MTQVKVYYDQTGNSLTVWFGEPKQEYVCEETGDEGTRRQVLDEGAIDAWCCGEIEAGESLLVVTPRSGEATS